MFKKILSKLKKLLMGLLVIAVVIGIIFGLRAIFGGRGYKIDFVESTKHDIISNESLKALSGSGYTRVAENNALMLYVNFDDGNIEVHNKENGFVWRSCPTEEEMALEQSNDLWLKNLAYPIIFTYVNDFASMDNKYGNVANQETVITVYEMENGVRVYFDFTLTGIKIAYDLELAEDHLAVSIPSYLISDPGEKLTVDGTGTEVVDKGNTFILTDFNLFPNLGATRGDRDIDGYFFVPDGTGALMRFDSDKVVTSQYAGHIYGADLALYGTFDSTLQTEMNKPSISHPVFGMVRDNNSLFAIIDKGETQADIIASKAGVQTGFHTIYPRFTYRMKYKIMTNVATKAGYMSYTRFNVDEDRKVNYYFDWGQNADYVAMASTYREYLMEKNQLTPIDPETEPAAMQLIVVGSELRDTFIGIDYVNMTTFDQAREILQALYDSGVKNIDVVYTGWGRYGESVEYPYRFPVASGLGGEKKLTELAAYVKELGYRLYLIDDNGFLDTTRGLSLRNDTVYSIQDSPLTPYGEGSYFATPAFSQRTFESSYEKYERYGISGIEEGGLSWILSSNYNKNAAMTREQMKQSSLSLIQSMLDKFGTLRLTGDLAYYLRDGVVVTALSSSSYLTLLDEMVPFVPIALHGLIEYNDGDYNNEYYEPRQQLLKAVERGANVSFTVSYAPTEDLYEAVWSYYSSTEFSRWKDEILTEYFELKEYLDATRGLFITDHQTLARDVVKVTYEGGVDVLVNYQKSPYVYNGVTIPAEDFVVMGGEE